MAQTTNIEMGAPNTRVQQPGSPAPDPADIIFGQRLARVGMPDIFYNPFRDPKESVINFGNLQRMVLHALQRELVKEVAKIETTKVVGMAQAEKIRDTLSKYCKIHPVQRLKIICVFAHFLDSLFHPGLGIDGRLLKESRQRSVKGSVRHNIIKAT